MGVGREADIRRRHLSQSSERGRVAESRRRRLSQSLERGRVAEIRRPLLERQLLIEGALRIRMETGFDLED